MRCWSYPSWSACWTVLWWPSCWGCWGQTSWLEIYPLWLEWSISCKILHVKACHFFIVNNKKQHFTSHWINKLKPCAHYYNHFTIFLQCHQTTGFSAMKLWVGQYEGLGKVRKSSALHVSDSSWDQQSTHSIVNINNYRTTIHWFTFHQTCAWGSQTGLSASCPSPAEENKKVGKMHFDFWFFYFAFCF